MLNQILNWSKAIYRIEESRRMSHHWCAIFNSLSHNVAKWTQVSTIVKIKEASSKIWHVYLNWALRLTGLTSQATIHRLFYFFGKA